MKLMMFSKHLAPLSVRQAGSVVKELGFDGVDLTVRPGGHVLPDLVRSALPDAIETLRDLGLEVPLVTTAITAADEACAVDIFEAAAACGVSELKLGYWRYREFGSFKAEIESVARKLDELERLAERTGVRANIHTHSGDMISASAFIVWHLVKDRNPAAIGAYVDPGHMVVEGGISTWKMALDLLAERITLVSIKDMAWEQVDDPKLGKKRWITKMVPLERGVVPWPEVFDCLRTLHFDGWMSIHSEYQGGHSWRDLTTQEVIEQTRSDLRYLGTVGAIVR